jgi:uncharacterized protein (TIGR02466 family)
MTAGRAPAVPAIRWIGSDRRKIVGAAAEALLREAMIRRPADHSLRLRLAGLMFDRSDFDAVGALLAPAVAAGDVAALELAGRAALGADDLDRAIALLERATEAPRALTALAVATARRDGVAAAMPLVARVLQAARADPLALNLAAKAWFVRGRADKVDSLCAALEAQGADTAQSCAIWAVAKTRLGDFEGARALFGPDRIKAIRGIPGADNAALAREILGHPNLVPAHPAHATAGGFRVDDPEIADTPALLTLAGLIRTAVEAYATEQALWNGRRLMGEVRLDIWAVVLAGEAHEQWHVHPSGAISGVYYVAVPALAAPGALQFGLLPFPPEGSNVEPAVTVAPEPGMLMLFPSSFAHRTLPTHSAAPRISVAFDAVPV